MDQCGITRPNFVTILLRLQPHLRPLAKQNKKTKKKTKQKKILVNQQRKEPISIRILFLYKNKTLILTKKIL